MNKPRILYCFPDSAGNPFQPSNGTEGMVFTESFCMNCLHCDPNPDGAKQCEILLHSMCYSPDDKEYPTEWVYDKEGWPVCTKWVRWDWGRDGDPDDPENPNPVPIISNDPNQLGMFVPEEVKEVFNQDTELETTV